MERLYIFPFQNLDTNSNRGFKKCLNHVMYRMRNNICIELFLSWLAEQLLGICNTIATVDISDH